MAKVGLIFGSNTGVTERVAQQVADAIHKQAPDTVEIHDLASVGIDKLNDYDKLIIGCPTWNVGELQDDWKEGYEKLDAVDLSGKKIAVFSPGDQVGYSDNFQDALGILGTKFMERGGELCCFTDAEDGTYEFNKSLGVWDGFFLGLAIDEDNQADQTDERVKSWAPLVVKELELA